MTPYEVTYVVGPYKSSVVVQADDAEDARAKARAQGMIPKGGQIVAVETRE
jgi:hypothetical protein